MVKRELVFDDWQKKILDIKGNILLCTGRQVGKTTLFAIKAAKRMLEEGHTDILIVSLTEDQAKLIIVMITDYLERHAKSKIVTTGRNKPTQNKIALKNGSMAIARPVGHTGDAVRGFTAKILIIDEAARMPDLAMVSAKPTLLTTSGEIWLCSTPHGRKGYFWECFNSPNSFHIFHISSEEVIYNRKISPSWTQTQRDRAIEFLQREKKEMSSLQYGQEYLGQFLEDLRQYFSDDLIMNCCVLTRSEFPARNCFMGVDIARMGEDETTFQIIDKRQNGLLQHRENIIRKKQLTTTTEKNIVDLAKLWGVHRIYIDAGSGSLGVGVFDNLIETDDVKHKVVAINNSSRKLNRTGEEKQRLLKEDLYDNLRALMERKQIQLLNDESVRLSLKSIQYEYIETYRGQTRLRIFGNYSHVVEGLVRAAWCTKEKDLNVWVRSIKV